MDDMGQLINYMINRVMELEEQKKFQELKDKGIIVDAVLICNPKHKGVLNGALHEMGIKKIPIVWENCVEDDKLYMVTDKDLVEHIKQSIHFEA